MYPELITIGNFSVSSFGVMVAAGFIIGTWMAARSFEEMDLPGDAAWSILTWCVVGGLLGAKLWFVAENVARNPEADAMDLLLSRAGLTFYGGFFGGLGLGLIGARVNKMKMLDALNGGAPTLAVGQALGRIGCFLVGDDYGYRSELPWAVAFPNGLPPTVDAATGEVYAVHPSMLYESAWLFGATALLWKRRGKSPLLFGEYLVLQGAGRLWVEAFRINPPVLGPLTNAQLVAIACLAVGSIGWAVARSRQEGATAEP